MFAAKVAGREGAMPKKACPDPYSCHRGLQARRVGRRQFEALDEELLGFLGAYLGAYLGGLLDMWVHQFGEPRGVDRVLVDRVEFRQDAAHGPDDVGRQPRDPGGLQQLLRQCGPAHPGRTADEVRTWPVMASLCPHARAKELLA